MPHYFTIMLNETSASFSHISGLLKQKPLFVFALASEAADEFEDVNPLIVGIGKVHAAYNLTKHIAQEKPSIIINLGSAGSNTFKRGEVICCTEFIQRDMDVTGLGYQKYETPFSGEEPLLNYGLTLDGLQKGICGTGDNFETAHSVDEYNVLDMEAYSLAYIAKKEEIPFLCLKYISDGADGAAAEDWLVQVHNAAAAFKKLIDQLRK